MRRVHLNSTKTEKSIVVIIKQVMHSALLAAAAAPR